MLPFAFSVDFGDATGTTLLLDAALRINVQVVYSLIQGGGDPSLMDNKGWNSLHFASQGGDTDIIDLIRPILTCPTSSQNQTRVGRH